MASLILAAKVVIFAGLRMITNTEIVYVFIKIYGIEHHFFANVFL